MQIDALATHASLWARMQHILDKDRLPHALLLTGPRHAQMAQFADRLMAILLCQSTDKPCGQCQACHLLIQGTHPDIHYVRQDTVNGPLKIDQIRILQHDVYQTPQRGVRRFIVIEPADKLNNAAANALLKILEEPPSHTSFILIAEQVSSIPATIMSRCQQYVFAPPEGGPVNQSDYLTIGQFYPEASVRAELFTQCLPMIDALCDVMDKKISPCTVAAQWSSVALNDLLWFLHLITAQAIRYKLLGCGSVQPWSDALMRFAARSEPENLFKQLDTITSLMSTLQQNITLNQTLAIEMLLLNYGLMTM